jgi:hypothetical protein
VHLPSFIDGGPFDIVTLIVAVAVAAAKCVRHKHSFISAKTGFSIIHGLTIFPLFVLAISAISTTALTNLLNSNKIILSGAGFVALLAILEREFAKENPL